MRKQYERIEIVIGIVQGITSSATDELIGEVIGEVIGATIGEVIGENGGVLKKLIRIKFWIHRVKFSRTEIDKGLTTRILHEAYQRFKSTDRFEHR
ncbi:MAG: hypothetical protein AB8B57_17090 [Congregibacter sp.]